MTPEPHRQDSAAPPKVGQSHPARAESDGFEPQVVDGPWDPHLRVAWLLLPSRWVWLSATVWWAWRLLAIHARGEFEAVGPASLALARGMLADVVILFAVFSGIRALTRLASPHLDPRTRGSRLAANAAMVLLFGSCLARIVDVVHGAVEKVPPTPAFWQSLKAAPLEYVFDTAALAAVLVSLAVAALVRYFVACDLESAQTTVGPMPPHQSTGLLYGVAVGGLALAAVFLLIDSVPDRGPSEWGRLPEVQMAQSARVAAAREALTATPELDP